MAARAGVDLHHGRARGLDAPAVQLGFLVTLDDREAELPGQLPCRAFQQRRLASPRGAHQVDGEYATAAQPLAAALGQLVVLGQHLLLQDDRAVTWYRALQVDVAGVVAARIVALAMLVALLLAVVVAVPRGVGAGAAMAMAGREQLHHGAARAPARSAHLRPP